MRRTTNPPVRLVWSDGERICSAPNPRNCLASAKRLGRLVKPEQQARRNAPASLLRRPRDPVPVLRRNTPPVAPLIDRPRAATYFVGHVLDAIPDRKDILQSSNLGVVHADCVTPDNQSSQRRTDRPVTTQGTDRTMRPMGKATTPAKFKRMFCNRVRSARILAGYTQDQVARELGIKPDTYSKYERRSPMPHYLVPRTCELLRVAPDDLYGIRARPDLDMEYEEKRSA